MRRAVIYGSAMGNSNLHNHKRCPLFVVGHAGGACGARPQTMRHHASAGSTIAAA